MINIVVVIISTYFLFTPKKNILSEGEKNHNQKILIEFLTKREIELFNYLINNPEKKYPDIANEFCVSEKTVSTHLTNIYKKLQVEDKENLLKVYKGKSKVENPQKLTTLM